MKKDNQRKQIDPIENMIIHILDHLNIKLNPSTLKLLIQIFKFVIVGVMATLIDFILLYVFKEFLHASILVSNTISFIVSTLYNYVASVKWVFDINSNKDPKRNFVIFITFSIIGLFINNSIMWVTTNIFAIYYLLSKVLATAIVMAFNFVTRKLFLE